MDTMEHRLRALSERGFRISITVTTESYGPNKGDTRFAIDLTKGDRYGAGGSMTATGAGPSLDLATRDALAAATAFLGDPEPPEAVRGAVSDLPRLELVS